METVEINSFEEDYVRVAGEVQQLLKNSIDGKYQRPVPVERKKGKTGHPETGLCFA